MKDLKLMDLGDLLNEQNDIFRIVEKQEWKDCSFEIIGQSAVILNIPKGDFDKIRRSILVLKRQKQI